MGALAVLFVIAAYFIPTIIAFMRSHKDAPAILALNLFLGWSVIGWFMSLLWALADPRGRAATQTVVIHNTQQMSGAPEQLAAQPVAAPAPVAHSDPSDRDTAFWDSLSDKNDPDQLEEYLIRFPSGRFTALANNKLARHGVRPADAPAADQPVLATVADVKPESVEPDTPASEAAATCLACNAALEAGAAFCDACGTPQKATEVAAEIA